MTPEEIHELHRWASGWVAEGSDRFGAVLRLIAEWERRGTLAMIAAERVAMCSELLGRCAGRHPDLKADVDRFLDVLNGGKS